MKKFIVICLIFAALLIFIKFCPAHDPNAPKPLNELIVAAPDQWKQVYGDTLETQMVYNLAPLRNNQLLIGQMINNLHAVDPNDAPIEHVTVEKGKTPTYLWQEDMMWKVNEIVDWINGRE